MVNSQKIIYFGTDEFVIGPLEALLKAGYEVVATITSTQYSPIGKYASEYGLKVLVSQSLLKDDEFFEEFRKLQSDLCVVASYGKIIPQRYLDVPKFGFLNLHPSLLPKYRGPSPVPATLLNGDNVTGVTIINMDAEMDHGPIVAQKEVTIEIGDDFITLIYKLFKMGAELLVATLPDYLDGKIELQEQDHSQATYSKLLKTEDAEIKLDDEIDMAINKIRALNPEPGTFVKLKSTRLPDGQENEKLKIKELRLKILGAEKIDQYDPKKPILELKDGYLLLKKVQPEGKKLMSSEEFMRGYASYIE